VTKQGGKIWDSYDKVKELGTGTFGTAFLCKHKALKEERVVKAVKKSRARMPVEDIEKEILVMRQVDHPHIVRLFEWYEDSNRIYLVMEALKGGTLRDVVLEFQKQRRGLREEWVRSVVCQCTEALAYCHGLRLIHKDLKDENIMLLQQDPNYSKPFAIIIDLGIAEMFSIADPVGREIGGTPATMAPEVWRGSFGPKCDVWSMGCLLFEMLAGTLPFMAKVMEPSVWITLHKKGPDLSLLKGSKSGKELCRLMLTFSEDKRPSMADCLHHEWFALEKRSLQTFSPNQFVPIQSFYHEVALKRSLLLELASKLPMSKAGPIVDLFEAVDADKDGTLTLPELQVVFQQMGMADEKLVKKIFKAMDVNKDGCLSFSEFAAAVLLLFKDLLDDRLHALFLEHDEDGNGTLDIHEAEEFLGNAALLLKNKSGRSSNLVQDLISSNTQRLTYPELRDKVLGPIQVNSPSSSLLQKA